LPRTRPLFLLAALLALSPRAEACTLWAAAGPRAEDGGTVLAKNRDWKPGQDQSVVRVRPDGGFRYVALRAQDADGAGLKAGTNERGLSVATATASAVPEPRRGSGGPSVGDLLASCATVEDVLARQAEFTRAAFWMVADRSRAAVLEVAPGGRTAVRTVTDGTLAQANHYVAGPFRLLNGRGLSGSRARLARIEALLAGRPAPLSASDFARFSEDRAGGPDKSLWRTGSGPDRSRTVASWIAAAPPDGPPRVRVVLADPGKPRQVLELVLDAAFWGGKQE
jgi:hypothetical protein